MLAAQKLNKVSIQKQQIKIRPEIEDIIPEYFEGNIKQAALDFIAYLRTNDILPKWTSAISWNCNYKRKRIFYLKLNDKMWTIAHFTFDKEGFGTFAADENLLDFIWANPNYCRQNNCHYSACARRTNQCEETYKGVKGAVLGKEFYNMCCLHLGDVGFLNNPDKQAIEEIKKIIGFVKQNIETTITTKSG